MRQPQPLKSELDYPVPGGKIALANAPDYFRTLSGIGLLLGIPPLYTRFLSGIGAEEELYRFQIWWGRRVREYLQIRLDVAGLKYVDPRQSYVVAPLHEGFADILALIELPLRMRFVARDELFQQWEMLGPLLRETGQIEISPEHGTQSYRQLLRSAHSVFERGESLVIFPQGTILGIESDFTAGAFGVAKALNKPILPVALTGSHRVWEYPYSPRLRYNQRLSMRVLPPIGVEEVKAKSRQELRQLVQTRLKAIALSGTMAAPRHFVPARDGYWDGYAYRIDPAFPELAADIARHRDGLNKSEV